MPSNFQWGVGMPSTSHWGVGMPSTSHRGVDNGDDIDVGMPSTSHRGVDHGDDIDVGMPSTSHRGIDNGNDIDGTVLNEKAIAEWLNYGALLGSSPFYLLPLISSESVIQDNNELVDKFEVQKCSVQKLANLYGSRNFYQDPANGLIIRFDQLEENKFIPLGILSRIEDLRDYFIKIGVLDGTSCDLMVSQLAKMGTGLYMLCPSSVLKSQNSTCYIFFYSFEDKDFKNVHSKSKAIHFFRYLTQLAPKLVAILNSSDFECLEAFKGSETTKRRIARKVEKMGTKKESCTAEFIGTLNRNQILIEKYLYSNTEGLSAIKTEARYSKSTSWTWSLDKFLELVNEETSPFVVDKDALVCPQFLSEFFNYQTSACSTDEEIDEIRSRELRERDSEMATAIVWQVAKQVVNPLEAKILEKFSQKNNIEFPLLTAGHFNCELKVSGKKLLCSCNENQCIGRNLEKDIAKWLIAEIRESGTQSNSLVNLLLSSYISKESRDYDTTFLSERRQAELVTIAGEVAQKMGKATIWQQNSEEAILSGLENNYFESISDEIKQRLRQKSERLCELAQWLKDNSEFIRMKAKTDVDNMLFKERIQNQRKQNLNPRSVIVRIDPGKKSKEFIFTVQAKSVCYTVYHLIKTDRHSEEKMCLDFSQFELIEKGSIEFSETESLLYCTCLKVSLYLFIHNSTLTKESRVSVWNVKVAGSQFDRNFRRPIQAAAYDPVTRVLCICNDESVQTKELMFFKFSESYRELTRRYSFSLTQAINQSRCISIALQPFSNCVWILTPQRLYKHNFEHNRHSGVVDLPGNFHAEDLKMLPDGSCVLVYSTDKSVFKVMCESLSCLGTEPHPSALFNDGFFTIGNQIIARSDRNKMSSIVVTGAKHTVKATKTEQRQDEKAKYHWLQYFHWVFYKFPVQDVLISDQESLEVAFHSHGPNHEKISIPLKRYIENMHKTLSETGKPLTKVAFFVDSVKVTEIVHPSKDFKEQPRATNMGDFLKHLITFVPIQIARCEFNSFYTLSEGKPLSDRNAKDTIDLTNKISMGLFEAIFNTWSGPVKVVSSMGKQSTGKSYTLNHMFGSSFDISGSRCTEGCWMTVKTTKDCLYVVLDFEGLGSFERSDQDDMLMSLFNSAISHMTIFKTENRIDKDMDAMFRRFHMASDRMIEVGDSFNGLLVIVIKDIDHEGINEVQVEFDSKMMQVIGQTEENFVSKMYQDGYQIFPFPRFDSFTYYIEIQELVDVLKEDERPFFASGTEFLSTMKLIAAKLSLNDFTPLSGQEIEARIRRLLENLETAMKFGQLGTTEPVKEEFKLRSMDDVTQEVAASQSIELPFGKKTHTFKWDDTSFTAEIGLQFALKQFSEINQTTNNFKQWRNNLQLLLGACVTARIDRVQKWLETNLRKFSSRQSTKFEGACKPLWDALRDKSQNLKLSLSLCNETCSECFLKCVNRQDHEGSHQCCTNHKCKSSCVFCTKKKENCKLKFGHEGQHICDSKPHLCGKVCQFKDRNNCKERCDKSKSHEGPHQCALEKHLCGEQCSLPVCRGRCEIDFEAEHTVHKCSKKGCPFLCCFEDCTKQCDAEDHFHGEMDLMIKYRKEQGIPGKFNFPGDGDHFCGSEHSCKERCETFEKGFCAIKTERENATQTFKGKRDTFEYVLKFEQKGTHKPCVKPIQPFRKNHEGGHFCSTDENEFHYCKEKCPQCSGICVKHFDHASKGDVRHKTIHGNMVNQVWASTEEYFEVRGRKYKVGESTVAEMCDAYCYRRGRGHWHLYTCDAGGKRNCPYDAVTDRRRHRPDEQMWKDDRCCDELTHDKYWEKINFEDPCGRNGCNFDMCHWSCGHSDHREGNKSYCVLKLWHRPVRTLPEAGMMYPGYVAEGHAFSCKH